MKRKLLVIMLSICVMIAQIVPACAADTSSAGSDSIPAGAEYAGDEILVSFSSAVSDRSVVKAVEQENFECGQISDACEDVKIAQVEITGDVTVEEAIEEFEGNSKVISAQPNYKYEFYDVDEPAITDTESKNYQYQISQVNADKAWELLEDEGYQQQTTLVGVIDTGVDIYHEDLQEILTEDITSNGYTQFAYNAEKTGVKYDSGQHGTHVSGIIGATYGNGLGGCGVASGTENDLVDLTVIGASDDGNSLYTNDVIKALYEAKEQGVKVINMSFGVAARDRLTEMAVKDLYDAGIVMVAASANDFTEEFVSPSSFKEVISVNAVTSKGSLAEYSNYGEYTDISAPGDEVYSTVPGDYYAKFSGTSMASPVVAAVCAMVLDANPKLTPAQVKNIICASTEKSFSNKRAFGIVDAEKAVQAAHDVSASVEVTGFEVKKDAKGDIITVEEGDYAYIDAIVRPANHLYSDEDITWTVADSDVAEVEPGGKVIGKSAGKTVVRASAAGTTVSIFVEVTACDEVTSFAIKHKDEMATMEVGEDIILNAITNVDNPEVYWECDNEDVAVVESTGEYGELLLIGEGTVTIKGMTRDVKTGNAEEEPGVNCDSVTIKVSKPTVTAEFVSKTDSLLVGESYAFKVKPLAEDGTETNGGLNISYESLDPSVAEVNSETGEVTAKKKGTTYIKAIINYLPYEIDFGDEIYEFEMYTYGKSVKLVVGASDYSGADYGLKVSSVTDSKVTLKWNKLNAVTGYYIYKKVDGKYTKVKTLSGTKTSYTDTNVNAGASYSYKVRAYYDNEETGLEKTFGYSSVVKAATKPSKVTGLKVSSGKKKAVLTWSKAKGADGYVIYRATKSTGKYVKVKTVTGTKFTNTKLTSDKKYWYKVKAYAKVDGKTVYGNYSSKVKASVK